MVSFCSWLDQKMIRWFCRMIVYCIVSIDLVSTKIDVGSHFDNSITPSMKSLSFEESAFGEDESRKTS